VKETRPRIATLKTIEMLNIELVNFVKTGHVHQFEIDDDNDDNFNKEERQKQHNQILISSLSSDALIKHKRSFMFCTKEYTKIIYYLKLKMTE
jgi:hypothetical protein